MAYSEKNTKIDEKRTWYYYVCPKCKRKMHLDRRYCICGAETDYNLYSMEAAEPPTMLQKKNANFQFFSCEACIGKCDLCASFSVVKTNNKGWGGLDCKHKKDEIRCKCCQLLIKNVFYPNKPDLDIDNGIREALKEVFHILKKDSYALPYQE